MGCFSWNLFFSVALPWLTGCGFLLLCRWRGSEKKSDGEAGQALRVWLVLLVLSLLPVLLFDGDADDDEGYRVVNLFKDSISRAWNATSHVLRFLLPFAVYPVAVYWIKLMANYRAICEEGNETCWTQMGQRSMKAQRQQSRLITWTIKVLVMIFVFFALLNRLGIETSEVLQITTVFSLGLSWSMRDWLSSLWGCFMLAFTTDLSCNVLIGLDINNANNEDKTTLLQVIKPGLMFTVCSKQHTKGKTPIDTTKYIYIPNATLVRSGFVLMMPQHQQEDD